VCVCVCVVCVCGVCVWCVCVCVCSFQWMCWFAINPLTPNDFYSGRTAPLTSKRYVLYIYSTNTGTEYFKHGIYCPFFFLSSKCSLFHNSNIFGSCFIHVLCTECAKIKKKNSGAKRLNNVPFSLYYLCKFCYYMSRNLGTRSLNLPNFQTIPL